MTATVEDDDEEERERYRELLEELRTMIPGVQVLFGFLLTVPFTVRFTEMDDVGVGVFGLALVTVGLATVVFLTPAAHHRISAQDDRRERLRVGVRTTVAGMALLAVAITAAVFVVTRLIFGTRSVPFVGSWSATTVAAVAAGMVGGGALALWVALPYLRGRRGRPTQRQRR